MVNNQLHLHFTQPQQFTKDNFQIILEATLRWVFPIALGQAAKLVTLPDIQEEEEAVEGEDWEDLENEESEEDIEDCALHLYAAAEVDNGHLMGTSEECVNVKSISTSIVTATSTTTRKTKNKRATKKGKRRSR
jgi:hypothetical protein